MKMSRFAFAAAFVVTVATSSAQAADSALDVLSFTVLRDGDEVGAHVVRFQHDNDKTSVSIDTNVVVKIALIPVYRFEHHGRETWENGRLTALDSKTNDDGTHHKLSVSVDSEGLAAKGDDTLHRFPADAAPASLWNRANVLRTTLMNTLDGHAMKVSAVDLGDDAVKAQGRNVSAHHFVISGDLNREVWYDAAGRLVKVRFKAKDDSDIQYVLK